MQRASKRPMSSEHGAFWLALISIATVVAALFWMLHQQYTREIEHARLETVNLSNMLLDETGKTLDQVALLLMGAHERLDRHLQHHPIHSLSAEKLFPAETGIASFVSSVALTDMEGQVLLASHEGVPDKLSLNFSDAFRGLGGRLLIGRPVFHASDRKWYIKICKKYDMPGHSFHGYLVATIMLDYFTTHFEKMQFDYPQPVSLYLNNGSLVAGAGRAEINHPNRSGGDLSRATLEKISSLRDGQTLLVEQAPLAGFPVMAGIGRMEDYPFIIRVDGNTEEMLSAWKKTAYPIVAASFVASAIIVFIAVLFYRNIQKEKLLQAELLAMSAKVHAAREMERAHFARELHDQLGQLLTGIKYRLAWFEHRLASNDEYASQLNTIKCQLDETIDGVRRMTAQLRPLILDDFGLYAALQWLVSGVEGSAHVHIVTHLPESEPPRGSDIASVIFRIVQEALNNIAKHADARQVTIQLENVDECYWRLTVYDDGTGFDLSSVSQQGFGLIAMRERVESMGGIFQITSTVGGGTRIQATIPTQSEHHEA